MVEMLVASAFVAGGVVIVSRRHPHLVARSSNLSAARNDAGNDLPCPWCMTPTTESDVRCPGCHQRFG
jgi:hypothetical protein